MKVQILTPGQSIHLLIIFAPLLAFLRNPGAVLQMNIRGNREPVQKLVGKSREDVGVRVGVKLCWLLAFIYASGANCIGR